MSRVATILAALVCGIALSGCNHMPASFQSMCDHAAAAQSAIAQGDMRRASIEVNKAKNLSDPAYEDTGGSRQFFQVSRAIDEANRATPESGAGRQALAAAVAACQ